MQDIQKQLKRLQNKKRSVRKGYLKSLKQNSENYKISKKDFRNS